MQALYRLYRPQKFSELVGQEHVSNSLLKALESGKISHAFLFIGPRGTGKTSTARIVAKSLNCLKASGEKWSEPCGSCDSCLAISEGRYLDLIEIDAASNRGIDEIRDLREKIKLAPTQGKFKVYIIDEVHMLTNEAFNALLKTLEEPPEHAKFILCTTDPQKIPATVRSRCQVYEFKTPTIEEITKVLINTAKEEKAELKLEDLEKIAKRAKGAYRDALVLLEKYIVTGHVDKDFDLVSLGNAFRDRNHKESLAMVHELIAGGVNPKIIAEDLLQWNRRALLHKLGVSLSPEADELKKYADATQITRLKEMIKDLTQSMEDFRFSPIPELPLELAIIGNESASTAVTTNLIAVSSEKVEMVEKKIEPVIEKKDLQPTETNLITQDPVKEEKIEVKDKNVEVTIATTDSKTTINIKKSGELESIQSQWGELLRKLKPVNHSLEALLRSSEPVGYDDGKLTLSFFYRFHKERVEDPKNRALVEKIFHEETGLPVHLNLVLSDAPKRVDRRQASQSEVQNVKIVDDKDLGEAALDIFSS